MCWLDSSHIWRRRTWFSLVAKICLPGTAERNDASATWECHRTTNHRRPYDHIRASSKTHLLRYCSPTNLLTQLSDCRMCRSVYIYDFENSIPYFYVPFFHIFSSSFFFMAATPSEPTASISRLIPDVAVCMRLVIYSFIHWRCVAVWHFMVNSIDCCACKALPLAIHSTLSLFFFFSLQGWSRAQSIQMRYQI